MDGDQRLSARGLWDSDRLFTRTIVLSIVALFLVILLHFQGFFGTATQFSTSRLSITLEEGNFDSRTTIQNVTITDSDVLAEEFLETEYSTSVNDEGPHLRSKTEMYSVDPNASNPQVALLFLSMGELHNEGVWRAFFEAAGRLKFRFQPPDRPYKSFVYGDGKELFTKINESKRRLSQAESIQNIMACDNEPAYLTAEVDRLLKVPDEKQDLIAKQQLFSVYTHPGVRYTFPETSMFYGTEIDDRVDTSRAWASFDLVAAEIKLLRAALVNEQNEKFILLSESCIPLHRPELIYLQMLAELKSRNYVCHPWEKRHQLDRWNPRMKSDYLKLDKWRKNSQWFALKRRHAELVVNDFHVKDRFQKYCRRIKGHLCVPDEHYIPTTISVYGLGNETDCVGRITAAWWPTSGRAHPVTFAPKTINSILFKKLRHMESCQVGAAQASTENLLIAEHEGERCLFYNNTGKVFAPPEDSDVWVVSAGYQPLRSGCPLFARKFGKNSIKETLKTALSCSGSSLGYWC